jgi:hypothetical protein
MEIKVINGVEYEIGPKANLIGVDLTGADLTGANLSDANLVGAKLIVADLPSADMSNANLSWANLFEANLIKADLSNANLTGATLTRANLSNANLSDANLAGASLAGANLAGAILPDFKITPDTGVFTGWKKVSGNVILELEIIGERNSSLIGRKCRTNKAKVVEAYNRDGSICTEKEFESLYDRKFKYVVGETICEPEYDPDIRVEYTKGIHFFMTRKEVKGY